MRVALSLKKRKSKEGLYASHAFDKVSLKFAIVLVKCENNITKCAIIVTDTEVTYKDAEDSSEQR